MRVLISTRAANTQTTPVLPSRVILLGTKRSGVLGAPLESASSNSSNFLYTRSDLATMVEVVGDLEEAKSPCAPILKRCFTKMGKEMRIGAE